MDRRFFYRLSSMNHWYPVISKIEGIRKPKTEKIFIGDNKVCNDKITEGVREIIERLGSPIFIRTDASSDKHNMEKASKIRSKEDSEIKRTFKHLMMHNMSAGGSGLPFNAVYLREWIDLKDYFKAFKQTPIAPELRFFIHNGKVLNSHFYWPEEAIRFRGSTEEPENWKDLLRSCREEALERKEGALEQAMSVAKKFRGQGFWSVDFALSEENEWYCIDMARGEVSWHPKKNTPAKPVTKLSEDYLPTVSDYEKLYDLGDEN